VNLYTGAAMIVFGLAMLGAGIPRTNEWRLK